MGQLLALATAALIVGVWYAAEARASDELIIEFRLESAVTVTQETGL